ELGEGNRVGARNVIRVELGGRADVQHVDVRLLLVEHQGRGGLDAAVGRTSHNHVARRRLARGDLRQVGTGDGEPALEVAAQLLDVPTQGTQLREATLRLAQPSGQPPHRRCEYDGESRQGDLHDVII